MRASSGGDDHSLGSNCFTSYMKYSPTVFFAPASSVAKTPGFPSVSRMVTCWNPASRASLAMNSAPAGKLRSSAAIEGKAIQSCSRFTDSSWRFAISVRMAAKSSAASIGKARANVAIAAARVFRLMKVIVTPLVLIFRGRAMVAEPSFSGRGQFLAVQNRRAVLRLLARFEAHAFEIDAARLDEHHHARAHVECAHATSGGDRDRRRVIARDGAIGVRAVGDERVVGDGDLADVRRADHHRGHASEIAVDVCHHA